MKVVWLRATLRNLAETAAYIAHGNVDTAARVVERLRRATDRLTRYPESGRASRAAGTRELVVPGLPFILAYRVRRGSRCCACCTRRDVGRRSYREHSTAWNVS